jgi:hypothetical protein
MDRRCSSKHTAEQSAFPRLISTTAAVTCAYGNIFNASACDVAASKLAPAPLSTECTSSAMMASSSMMRTD